MKNVTVSSKYQVVIPKEVRRQLQIKPGQQVYFGKVSKNKVEIKTDSVVEKLYGSMKGAFGADSTTELEKMRVDADRDRV